MSGSEAAIVFSAAALSIAGVAFAMLAASMARRVTNIVGMAGGIVILAVAVILPWFERVAVDDAGRDRRFAEAVVTVRGLPNPALPSLCPAYGAFAEPLVRDRLCRHGPYAFAADFSRLPGALTDARRRLRSAFIAPLNETQTRLADLRLQQREGLGDLLVLSNAIEATEAELQPFVNRYVLDGPEGTGPTPPV